MFLNSYLCCTSCCRIAALKKVPKEGLKVKEVYRLEHVKYIFENEVHTYGLKDIRKRLKPMQHFIY